MGKFKELMESQPVEDQVAFAFAFRAILATVFVLGLLIGHFFTR